MECSLSSWINFSANKIPSLFFVYGWHICRFVWNPEYPIALGFSVQTGVSFHRSFEFIVFFTTQKIEAKFSFVPELLLLHSENLRALFGNSLKVLFFFFFSPLISLLYLFVLLKDFVCLWTLWPAFSSSLHPLPAWELSRDVWLPV